MTLSEINPFDYDADAKDRIWRLLEIRNISWRDQLKQSADTAGAQLEYLKPSLIGGHVKDGSFYAGPAVMASSGTVLIVLAHHKKVFTVSMLPGAGHTFAKCIAEAVDYAREVMGDDADKCSADMLGHVIKDLVKKYGRTPGRNNAVELTNEHNVRIIGMLFMPMPDAAKADMANTFEQLITMGVCPALIGLLGKGSEKGLSMAWPLPLALAPYADAVIKE